MVKNMIYDFSSIHRFQIDDTRIVLDINTGIVHVLSTEAWDLLDSWERAGGDPEKAVASLAARYNAGELQEIMQAFQDMAAEGTLFSRDQALEGYRAVDSGIVKALCLHVAHDCNLGCRYCFAGMGDFGGPRGLMSLETGKKSLDFLFSASGPRKHIEVDYFGGEPLLNFEVVKELISYGKEKAQKSGKVLKQTLTTNTILLDEGIARFLTEENISLILSIDGRPEVHDRMRPYRNGKGSYQRVSSAIRKHLAAPGLHDYYVRGTYTHFNLDFSEDVLHLVKEGFLQVSLEPVVASPENDYALKEEDLPLLYEQYERLAREWLFASDSGRPFNFFHFNISLDKGPCLPRRLSGCGAGNEYLAVTPEGELYPCHQFVGKPEFLLGDVTEGLSSKAVRERFLQAHILNKKECRNCWARFYCGGGCHANAYNFNSDLLIPYELGCRLQRKRLECAIYVHVKKAESSMV
jgi:uncharacterized protein